MTKYSRILFLVLFLTLVLAVHTVRWAHGQVAAPDFPPAAPHTLIPGDFVPDANFAPLNPAAVQWGAPSRFGLGQINSKVERENGLGVTDTTKYDGYYAGLRWVNELFTLGGEVVDLEDDDSTFDVNVKNAALAFPIAKILAIGIGMDTSTTEAGSLTYERRTPTLGLSVALDETFYIGLSMGREYMHIKQPGEDYDSDRAVQTFGVGIRKGGAGTQFHLEYYVLQRDPHENEANFEFDAQDQSHVVLEMNWQSILLSAHFVDFEHDTNDGTGEVYILGWAPKKGLAFIAQYERAFSEDGLGAKTNAETTSVSIAYQF